MIYEKDCIPKIQKILDDETKDEKIRKMAKKVIEAIADHNPPKKYFLKTNPIDY